MPYFCYKANFLQKIKLLWVVNHHTSHRATAKSQDAAQPETIKPRSDCKVHKLGQKQEFLRASWEVAGLLRGSSANPSVSLQGKRRVNPCVHLLGGSSPSGVWQSGHGENLVWKPQLLVNWELSPVLNLRSETSSSRWHQVIFRFHVTDLMRRCPVRAQAWRGRFQQLPPRRSSGCPPSADVFLAATKAPTAQNSHAGTIPCEQDCDVVMQGMGISFNVDALLPFAKASQGVVCVVGDFQILLPM